MNQSKSEALDELRYEIGRLGDRLTTARHLLKETIRKIVQSGYIYSTSCVYTCKEDGFYLLMSEGEEQLSSYIPFGHNHHSLCAIRGKPQIFVTKEHTQIFIPSYVGHHLQGLFIVYSSSVNIINRDDLDFFSEIVKYLRSRLIALGEL